MRRTLFFCTATLLASVGVSAQTPPAPRTPTAPAPRAAAAKPSTMTVQVTDGLGAPLADATVAAAGPVPREGVTAADGSVRLLNMRPGGYRVRVVREGSITLERDVTLRAGETLPVDVVLSPAPAPPVVAPPQPGWRQ